MKKISVIGYSGSGKSTLAERIGSSSGFCVLHLDRVHYLPGWAERDRGEERKIVSDYLDSHENWVIDGNYTKLEYERRMQESDLIIFMNFNRFTCLYRVLKRYHTYRNNTRPDMAEGCPEKVDAEFIRWVLHGGRTRQKKQQYNEICRKYAEKTVILRNQRELDRWQREFFRDRSF